MAENDKDFELAWLDQQIEHPADSLDGQARQLLKDLKLMYQPTQSDILANVNSLQRVQERLQTRFEPAHQETTVTPFHVSHTYQERKSFMRTFTGERITGRWRFSHTLNILAAVLVVAVLIGGAVTLLTLKNHTRPGASTGISNGATATPLPKLDCSRIFAYNDSYPDNGEHAVCQQGEETPLQDTATLGGHKLTLIAAYADANRLLIKYSVSGKDLSRYDGGTGISSLTVQDPAQTLSIDQNQTDTWSIGGGYIYDPQKDQTVFLASFSTQQVVVGTTSLQITADFSTVIGASPSNPVGTNTEKTSLSFTIPFHTEKRVATPNQSVVINGHRLTLTQVVVTASATFLFVKTDEALTPSQTSHVMEAPPSATINGNNNVSGAFTTNGIVNGKWDPVTGFSLGAPEDWLSQPTSWTLSLRSQAPPLGNGNGTLQFTISH